MMIRPAHSTPLIAALEQLGPRLIISASIYEASKSTSLSLFAFIRIGLDAENCVLHRRRWHAWRRPATPCRPKN